MEILSDFVFVLFCFLVSEFQGTSTRREDLEWIDLSNKVPHSEFDQIWDLTSTQQL